MDNNIFKFVFNTQNDICNFCEEKCFIDACWPFGSGNNKLHLCETHFEQFKKEVDEYYNKIKDYKKLKKELEIEI